MNIITEKEKYMYNIYVKQWLMDSKIEITLKVIWLKIKNQIWI